MTDSGAGATFIFRVAVREQPLEALSVKVSSLLPDAADEGLKRPVGLTKDDGPQIAVVGLNPVS